MFKKYKVLKWAGVSVLGLVIILISFGLWFKSLIPPKNTQLETSLVTDLPYLSENIIPTRGKILAVVTSTSKMGNTEKRTGYELSELARAYYVFRANGFEVDIASPLGGKPPVIIDDEDMGAFDYAFLNDTLAQYKTSNTVPVKDIIPQDYVAVFFAGGKGAMFDFPDNKDIQHIIKKLYQSNKVVGAVCHGPAALVNVMLDDGNYLLENKMVSGFTNKEELLLIPEAKEIFPFLLQDKMIAQGAKFNEGSMYLEKMSHDENLITGQNPWSTWVLAEAMVKQMGYVPKHREITDEENAEKVLSVYKAKGKKKAKEVISQLILKENKPFKRILIAKHGIVAAMKGEIGNFIDMIGLVSFAKHCEAEKMKI
ncbi:type 1 glutamine amidotransferase domain-containing protein [Aquimarina gracilis]|uniref:Type 1 glutamine amidotransferase domain-containing protein n=1 Tax=Aquimarina gracilis TaxID=874422 RepID=A0ABU5ZX71_9FLAO|nr:type 1 glutamine amidotransferase domain-containing protein [Aquimarina gracilis]MEB3346440.1 type 1 glutamine amidotransferase domain-containing protein [Aquimarina gracilis]